MEGSSAEPQHQGSGQEGLPSNIVNVDSSSNSNNNNHHLHQTTSSKAPSGKGSSKSSKKKTQHSKSSKQTHSNNSSPLLITTQNNNHDDERRKEDKIYLENFIKSIEYLPIEVKKDLGTIKELDKKTSKNITLSNELASDSSKSNADRNEAIRKLMDESIHLSLEKVEISQRSISKVMLYIEDLDKKIEELSQNLQQKSQANLKLESLYIPQLSEDNQVHYFTPSDSSLQSSSSKSNKRLVQHSENLKTLKSGSLKSYPEKEMHAHVFNHSPEQEGIVRGNSTTTRSYSNSSSTSTKKTEKEPPSQITVKTSSGNVIAVPSDRVGNSDSTLISFSSEQKIKKQKKSSQPKQESAPVNCTPLSIHTTSGSTSRKEKSSTSSTPKENSIIASSEISSIKIPKKDSSSSSNTSSSSSHSAQNSSTKKSRSNSSSTSALSSNSTNSITGEQSKTGKKRKPISSNSNTGKTKKQKQSAAISVEAATPLIEQPIVPDDNTVITAYEDLMDPTPYCYCRKTMAEDSSEMIGCDNSDGCPNNGWIHRHCLKPGEDPNVATFYCVDCIKTKKKKKK